MTNLYINKKKKKKRPLGLGASQFVSRFLPQLVYDCSISLLELSDIFGLNCVEVKLCVLMVWFVMCCV